MRTENVLVWLKEGKWCAGQEFQFQLLMNGRGRHCSICSCPNEKWPPSQHFCYLMSVWHEMISTSCLLNINDESRKRVILASFASSGKPVGWRSLPALPEWPWNIMGEDVTRAHVWTVQHCDLTQTCAQAKQKPKTRSGRHLQDFFLKGDDAINSSSSSLPLATSLTWPALLSCIYNGTVFHIPAIAWRGTRNTQGPSSRFSSLALIHYTLQLFLSPPSPPPPISVAPYSTTMFSGRKKKLHQNSWSEEKIGPFVED